MEKKKPLVNKTHTIENGEDFVFEKENYTVMLVGIAVLIIGFVLLSGGNSNDPNVFNPEVFSFRRITLAPIVILIGFGIEFYAILKKTKA
jgi:hypothetical protein